MPAPEEDPRLNVHYFNGTSVPSGHAREPAADPPFDPIDTVSAATFATRTATPRQWLVKDLIPHRTVTLFIGDGATGKSLLALQLAVAVAADRDWIGMLPEQGNVLYASAEDELNEVQLRLIDITKAANVAWDELAELHIWPLAGKDAVLALQQRQELLTSTPRWQALVDKLRSLRPRLLIIDNLADAFAGNENSRPQARQFIGMLRGLAIDHDLTVILLSHPSVSGMASGSGTSGSTAWSNSARSRLYLERAKAGDGDEPDPDLRILRLMKANHAAVGTEIRIRWDAGRFKLESGGVGAFDRIAAQSHAETVFLELLRAFTLQGRDVSEKPSPNYAPAIFAAHPDSAGIAKKAFTNAMNRLFARESIRVETFGPSSRTRRRIVVTE